MTTFALITGMVYVSGTAEEQMMYKAGTLISSIVGSHLSAFITPVKLYERMSHILLEVREDCRTGGGEESEATLILTSQFYCTQPPFTRRFGPRAGIREG